MPEINEDVKAKITGYIRTSKSIPTCFGDVPVVGPILGQGGNGLVYPVTFEGPAVAKILTEAVSATPSTTLKRFQREYTRLVRTPQHTNLVKLFHFDVVTLGDVSVPAIIMEQCAKSLKKHVQESGRLQSEELRRLFVEMCRALHHIQQHGIIHRDVKPENILVRSDGTFVLADFGIAKFDPELFPGTELTQRGDRMANVQFSAPEQFEKDAALTPATDIFALGQVLYWCVTQNTFRGTAPRSMASVDLSYLPFDAVVSEMSRQAAHARPQSAKEAYDIFIGKGEEQKEQEREQHILDSLIGFEEALRSCTPGQRGIVHFTSKNDIDHLMHTLAGICDSHDLWWTQGHGNDALRHIAKLDEEHWMFDITEMKITGCWISRDPGVDHCFVLIRTEAMPPFGVYEPHEFEDEMVGLVDGVFIKANEHDDGFARIGGAVVDVRGKSKLRRRFLLPRFFFIGTKYNPILDQGADPVLYKMIEAYQSGSEVKIEDLRKLWKLPIHPVSRKHN